MSYGFRRALGGVFFSVLLSAAAIAGAPSLELSKWSFFLGREYFVLRSGRAQLILQADRADLGPAFTYLLFDAQNAQQSRRKDGAYNFDPEQGFASSGLEVVLGGFAFTALGHRTDTRWISREGIPAVEASWWAGGIRVIEHVFALQGAGAFQRSITLEGGHLIGKESASLRLCLPPGKIGTQGALLHWKGREARMAVTALGGAPARMLTKQGCLEVGPLEVGPDEKVTIETLLLTQIPSGDLKLLDLSAQAAALELRTREKWAAMNSLQTGDRVVGEIFDKARFGLPGMVADDGTMDAGIFEYGAQWVRDTSNTTLGLIHIGEFELARRTLERILTTMFRPDGAAMIAGGFDTPDREQFDQMGEFLHVMKAYRDWSGDDSLIRQYRAVLLAIIERPLSPQFRDATGMVHNRREFWERAFEDAYELAYQTWVIQGLRDGADLARELGAEEKAAGWRFEAERIRTAMLSDPRAALVDGGKLIKRRNVTGEIADLVPTLTPIEPDSPAATEKHHRLFEDTSLALPIAMKVVAPRSELSWRTLDSLEKLWNTRWSDGGYDRYHTSSQLDQPGPWPFATCFVMRAQHEAGLYDRSRRALEWLNSVQGGRAGTWFEEIPSTRTMEKTSGLVQWTSGEIALFSIRHWLGVSFEADRLVIRPALFPRSSSKRLQRVLDAGVWADLRFRGSRLRLQVDGPGEIASADVNGVSVHPDEDGALRLPVGFAGGTIVIRVR